MVIGCHFISFLIPHISLWGPCFCRFLRLPSFLWRRRREWSGVPGSFRSFRVAGAARRRRFAWHAQHFVATGSPCNSAGSTCGSLARSVVVVGP